MESILVFTQNVWKQVALASQLEMAIIHQPAREVALVTRDPGNEDMDARVMAYHLAMGHQPDCPATISLEELYDSVHNDVKLSPGRTLNL